MIAPSEPEAVGRAEARPTASERVGRLLRGDRAGLSIAVLLVFVLLSVTTQYFFSYENIRNISTAISYTGIVAAIETVVLVGGGVDLSISAVMAISGTAAAGIMDAGLPAGLAIAAGIGIGLAAGIGNAVLVTTVGINPLIATIATQFIFRGLAFIIINSQELLISNSAFLYLGQGKLFGLPMPSLLMVVAFLVVGFILRFTVFGRHVFAIGGTPNGQMAKLAGVPVAFRQYQMYIASGVVSGMAGIVLASYSGSAAGDAATGLELTVIAAVILGGTALGGGRGGIIGTVLGVVLLGLINNGLTLRNVPTVWLDVVQGAVLLIAVVVDERRRRARER